MDIYRIALVAVALSGLICTCRAVARPLVYFTVQTNLLLVAYFLGLLAGWVEPSASIKGAVTLFAMVTSLIAHFVLGRGASPLRLLPRGEGNDVRAMGELLLHYVAPILTLADWLIFDRARRPGWTEPLLWLTYPVLYLVFALIRGALLAPSSELRYPYPFLDAGRLGYRRVALQAAILTTCIAVLGYALVALRYA